MEFEAGDRVIHPTRGKAIVVSTFRQTMGDRKLVCWVSCWKGEQHAVDSAVLEPDPTFRWQYEDRIAKEAGALLPRA